MDIISLKSNDFYDYEVASANTMQFKGKVFKEYLQLKV